MHRPHERVSVPSLGAYKYFFPKTMGDYTKHAVSREPARGGSTGSYATCVDCHFWYPLSFTTRMGRCQNPSSAHFGKPAFHDKTAERCFVPRSIDGLEFLWCEDHRETIYKDQFPKHRGCRVFVASADLPVEDEVEFTLAGD